MNSESRTWLLRFPYILYMAMTTLGAPPSPAREQAFKTALTAREYENGLLGEIVRDGRQQVATGSLMQEFLKALKSGKTNLAQGLLSCIEVINNELSEHESEAFKQMAFDLAAAIAEHATTADKEKDFKFIKNLRVWMAMM
jgi:hypothetical protein